MHAQIQTQAQPANTTNPLTIVNKICSITQNLIDLAEQESQALIMQDPTRFMILQDEKEDLSIRYVKASQEFHSNLDALRSLNVAHIDRLTALQQDLKARTDDNNALIKQIQDNAPDAANMANA